MDTRASTRFIGKSAVSAIGLGAMPMSVEGRPDEPQAIRTIHAALDAGVTLIDTADSYCLNQGETGHNERLIAKALKSWKGDRRSVLISTKGGHYRPGDGSWLVNGRPEYVKKACDASLRALEVDVIDLYHYHRPDPEVPWAESVGALADLAQEGKIRMAGVSNATEDQIREAMNIVDLASVQNELSPAFRSSAGELALCEKEGVAFLAWSPLGGIGNAKNLAKMHPVFVEVARSHGVSPQQVALAWLLAKSPVCIPIPGSTRPETIVDSFAAIDLELTPEGIASLDAS